MPIYYGQGDPPADDIIFKNYFPIKKDGFFIECGANNGVSDCTCLFFEKLGWRGVNIEPCLESFKILETNRPNSFLNLNIGLAEFDGRSKFTKAIGLQSGGSIRYIPKWKEEVARSGYRFEETTIDVLTYKTLMEKYDLPHVDLFVLDVDGYELEIIDGMFGSRTLPQVICVEYTLVKLENLINKLIPLGYNYDFLSYNNAFFSMGVKRYEKWYGQTKIWDWGG